LIVWYRDKLSGVFVRFRATSGSARPGVGCGAGRWAGLTDTFCTWPGVLPPWPQGPPSTSIQSSWAAHASMDKHTARHERGQNLAWIRGKGTRYRRLHVHRAKHKFSGNGSPFSGLRFGLTAGRASGLRAPVRPGSVQAHNRLSCAGYAAAS
jgi:hypothetical protein